MKIFITLALFCLLGNSLSESLDEEFKAAEDDCLKEKHLTRNEVFGDNDLTNPKPGLKIFAGCFLGKVGFIKDNVMQEDVMLKRSKDFKYPKFFKHCVRVCRHTKGIDHDDTAYKMGLCFRKVDTSDFLKEWKLACKDCKEEQQLSEEEYTKLQHLPVDNPTPALKQYTACVFEKEGFLKDNILQENDILEVSDDYKDAEYLKTFVNECKHIKENNQTETAFKLYECLQKIKDTH